MAQLKIEIIWDMETGAMQVKGPMDQKPMVCSALARAIVSVIEHTPPVIRPTNGNGHLGIVKN